MKDNSTKAGIGLFEMLAILFLTLKLCKVIDWQWVWVLSPIWIPIAIMLISLAVCGCILLKDKWEMRGTVFCKRCKYSGVIKSESVGRVSIHCNKFETDCSPDYGCKFGERRN